MAMVGGASSPAKADQEVQNICDQVRADLEKKAGQQFAEYEAVLVCRQMVAGTNFFVKIHIGNESYVHARIFRPLPCNGGDPELHSYQADKTKDAQIGYF